MWAARQMFVEHGYDGVRMAALAKRVGMSEGSIYSYFSTKSDLMQAIVIDFWREIADGARASVSSDDPPFQQLCDLAEYHLATVIKHFDFLDLTVTLRRGADDNIVSREQLRAYTSVFDDIFRKAVDCGEISPDVVMWLVRDTFFGTLEYSARSILGRRTQSTSDMTLVIDNLLEQIQKSYGLNTNGAVSASSLEERITTRLESVADRLEGAMTQLARDSNLES